MIVYHDLGVGLFQLDTEFQEGKWKGKWGNNDV